MPLHLVEVEALSLAARDGAMVGAGVGASAGAGVGVRVRTRTRWVRWQACLNSTR